MIFKNASSYLRELGKQQEESGWLVIINTNSEVKIVGNNS